jgi:hypothetical protein
MFVANEIHSLNGTRPPSGLTRLVRELKYRGWVEVVHRGQVAVVKTANHSSLLVFIAGEHPDSVYWYLLTVTPTYRHDGITLRHAIDSVKDAADREYVHLTLQAQPNGLAEDEQSEWFTAKHWLDSDVKAEENGASALQNDADYQKRALRWRAYLIRQGFFPVHPHTRPDDDKHFILGYSKTKRP